MHFNFVQFLFTNILATNTSTIVLVLFHKWVYECRYPIFYAVSDKY